MKIYTLMLSNDGNLHQFISTDCVEDVYRQCVEYINREEPGDFDDLNSDGDNSLNPDDYIGMVGWLVSTWDFNYNVKYTEYDVRTGLEQIIYDDVRQRIFDTMYDMINHHNPFNLHEEPMPRGLYAHDAEFKKYTYDSMYTKLMVYATDDTDFKPTDTFETVMRNMHIEVLEDSGLWYEDDTE